MSEIFQPAGGLVARGDRVVINPEVAGWEYSGLRVFRLDPGETRRFELHGVEGAVLPLVGGTNVDVTARDSYSPGALISFESAATSLPPRWERK